MEYQLPLLYEDKYISAFNKPADLLVHRSIMGRDKTTVIDILKRLYDTPPSPVHRLDRATSGVILTAFEPETARLIGDFFTEGKVKKSYLMVVRGWPPKEGQIDTPLKDEKGGEVKAQTFYTLLNKVELNIPNEAFPTSRYALVEARPATGKYHQLRRHFAQAGYPILGDSSHGDLRHNRRMADYLELKGLHLHAEKIELPHPHTGANLTITAPLPETRIKAWNLMGFQGWK